MAKTESQAWSFQLDPGLHESLRTGFQSYIRGLRREVLQESLAFKVLFALREALLTLFPTYKPFHIPFKARLSSPLLRRIGSVAFS